jgi:hypothetical protein
MWLGMGGVREQVTCPVFYPLGFLVLSCRSKPKRAPRAGSRTVVGLRRTWNVNLGKYQDWGRGGATLSPS